MLQVEDRLSKGIYDSAVDCIGCTPAVRLKRLFSQRNMDVVAKLEYMNPGGSMKDRPARFIIEQGLRDGVVDARTHLIESTSGNLGIALAMVANVYGLPFTCVIDPKTTETNETILRKMGARVVRVDEPDDSGGYLKTRIRKVKELIYDTPHGFWINQYANELNWKAHYFGAGKEMAESLEAPVDYLVAAVSTSGSIMGCARCLREQYPQMKVVAVDAVGSVIFGADPGPRDIPGIGSSRVPEILNGNEVDEVVYVDDQEAVRGCRDLIRYEGIFAGGSSGAVVAAIQKRFQQAPDFSRIVTLLPDRGDRYLDSVYGSLWESS